MAASSIGARDDDRASVTEPGLIWLREKASSSIAVPFPARAVASRRLLGLRLRLLTLLLFAGAAATVGARSPERSYGSPPAGVRGTTDGYGVARPMPEPDRYFLPPSPLPPQYDAQPQLQTRPGDAFPDPPRAYPTPPRHYPTPPRTWPQGNTRSNRP